MIARVLKTVALPALFILLLGAPLSAQEGTIVIEEPVEWSEEATRGIAVRPQNSLRIVGVARHPEGIRHVLINGARAALSPFLDGGMRFTGFLPIDEGVESATVTLEARSGDRLSRVYPIEVEAGPPEGGVEAAQDEAGWLGGTPDFDGERWAVVIGISDYDDPRITPLQYAHKDAQAFYEFLTSPQAGLGGFQRDHVLFLTNEDATYFNIRRALVQFLQQPTEDDVVFVYFAGHGAPDPSIPDDLYLIPYDGTVDELAVTGISMADVRSAIRRTRARQIFVFTDACHSGAVAAADGSRSLSANPINSEFLVRMGASQGGYLAFTSSEPNQYSKEGEEWGGGHGVFTYHLVRGLRGAADQNSDRVVTAGELVEWVRDRVRRETSNTQVPSVSATSYDRYWPMSLVASDSELLEVTPATEGEPMPEVSGTIMLGLLSEEWWAADSLISVVGSPDTVTIRLGSEAGESVPGHHFAWVSSNPNVAQVDQFGVIHPQTPGLTNIRVRVNQKEKQIPVRVYEQPAAVRFTPSESTVDLVRGEELRISAAMELPTGEVVRGLLPRFELQDTLVVNRRAPGIFDALRDGEAVISGRLGGVEKRWTVRVRPPALRIADIPSPILLGDTIPLMASYVREDGSLVGEALGSTWESTNPEIVRVSTAGAEAVGVGKASVLGSVGPSSDTASVYVLGDLLVTTEGETAPQIHTLDVEAGELIPILADRAGGWDPVLSPDGSKIAFVSEREGGRPRIFMMDADGRNIRRVTRERGGPLGLPIRLYQEHSPAWSADGERIFFISNNTGDYEVYSIRTDGTQLNRITSHGAMDRHVATAPDAPRIVFERSLGAENTDILSALDGGTELVNLTDEIPHGMLGSQWSEGKPSLLPGGKRMVFVETGPSYRSGESLALFDLTTETRMSRIVEPQQDHEILYAISRDGQKVVYHQRSRLGSAEPLLVVADLEGTTLQTVRLSPDLRIRDIAWGAIKFENEENR